MSSAENCQWEQIRNTKRLEEKLQNQTTIDLKLSRSTNFRPRNIQICSFWSGEYKDQMVLRFVNNRYTTLARASLTRRHSIIVWCAFSSCQIPQIIRCIMSNVEVLMSTSRLPECLFQAGSDESQPTRNNETRTPAHSERVRSKMNNHVF